MLGGIKAALGRNKSVPILPLSGEHVLRSRPHVSPHPLDHIFTDRSSTVDEEAPRATTPAYAELESVKVNPESLHRPRKEAAPKRYTQGTSGPASGSPDLQNEGLGSDKSKYAHGMEIRIGSTQLVISLALDILGPQGLLAQLGLPGVHELQSDFVRIQCQGVEVHHRKPADAPPDASKSLPGMPTDPEQFYIGDSETERPTPETQKSWELPPDFAKLGNPSTFSSSAGPRRPKPTSIGAMAALRPGGAGTAHPVCVERPRPVSLGEVHNTSGSSTGLDSVSEAQRIVAMKELEELKRKNLQLQSDLNETLRSIEEDTLSTPCSSVATPQTVSSTSISGSMKALFWRSASGKLDGQASGVPKACSQQKPTDDRGMPTTPHLRSEEELAMSTHSGAYSDAHTEVSFQVPLDKELAAEYFHKSPPPPSLPSPSR